MADIEVPIDDTTPLVVVGTKPTFFQKWKRTIGFYSAILLLLLIIVPISISYSKPSISQGPSPDPTPDPTPGWFTSSHATYTFNDNLGRLNIIYTPCEKYFGDVTVFYLDGKWLATAEAKKENFCQTDCFDIKNGTVVEIIHYYNWDDSAPQRSWFTQCNFNYKKNDFLKNMKYISLFLDFAF